MLFAVGTRVRLRHSRETGVVSRLMDAGMVEVVLDRDQLNIPVAVDDLLPLEARPKAGTNPAALRARAPAHLLSGKGILLAFLPGEVEGEFLAVLANDAHTPIVYSLEKRRKGHAPARQRNQLEAGEIHPLGDFFFDELNDQPAFHVQCWEKKAAGTGSALENTLRIRPKTFFRKQEDLPILGRRATVYVVGCFEASEEKHTEDLRQYTRERLNELPEAREDYLQVDIDLWEVAEFNPVLDLHLDALVEDPAAIPPQEILRLQLEHFERFVQKAYRLGLERVFVIHGLGKGRLRQAVRQRLREMPMVLEFNNDYHPHYGFGATEVIFH